MSLTILNNISSLTAENALSNTQTNLQKTLTQLSTGLKINSGSDDAAGLSVADGMQANIAALTQSQQNASNGIGQLQTADGALSQTTNLLNRAITLATEASNSGLTSSGSTSQASALDNEFQSILSEINQIGQTTDFNGQNVFASGAATSFTSTQGSSGSPLATSSVLAAGTISISDAKTGGTFVYTSTGAGSNTINALETAIGAAVTEGTLSANVTATISSGQVVISEASTDSGITVSSNSATLGAMNAAASTTSGTDTVYLGDSSTSSGSNTQISTTISALSATSLGLTSSGVNLNLTTTTNAQTALNDINAAISKVASQRGTIGAAINRLTAASNVENNEVSNLQSATNSIENADIGVTVANMTQYNVLQSTGMAALQQSNQAQQAVLKLVQ